MTQLATITAGAGADTAINQNNRALAAAALFGIRQAGTAGLTLGYFGGAFNGVDVADGTVSLTASATNYVVANRTSGAVTAATTTTNWLDSTNYLQLYQLVAGSSTFTIAATSDRRQAYGLGSGSGGSFTGGTLTSALNEAPPTTIASSAAPAATAIGAAAANTVTISGVSTITGFDSIAAGAMRRVVFSGALILTHNATSLILPTGANISTAAGDSAEFLSLGSGNWRCVDYQRANGQPLASTGAADRSAVSVLATSSGIVNIDHSLGDYFTLALSANVTSITFSNLPGSGKGGSIVIRITQDSSPRTVAWPASFRWEGAAPVVSTGSGAVDLLGLTTLDNGTKWDAVLSKARI